MNRKWYTLAVFGLILGSVTAGVLLNSYDSTSFSFTKTTTVYTTQTVTNSNSFVVIHPIYNSTLNLWIANVSSWNTISIHIQEQYANANVHFSNSLSSPFLVASNCVSPTGYQADGNCGLNGAYSGIVETNVQGVYVGITPGNPSSDNITIFATRATGNWN